MKVMCMNAVSKANTCKTLTIFCKWCTSNSAVLDEATVSLDMMASADEGDGITVTVTLEIPPAHTLDVDVTVTVNTALDMIGTNPGR